MADAMLDFVANQNIRRYRLLLQEETHPDKRRILLQLLAEEAAKLPEPITRPRHSGQAGFQSPNNFFVSTVETTPLSSNTVLGDKGAVERRIRRPQPSQE